jgi:hypothetical protein
LLSLYATANYLSVAQPRSTELANVYLALRGKLKGEALEEACHLVPIATVNAFGLTPRLGVRRDVEAYANLGISNGWMFRSKKGEAERMAFYKPYMFELNQRVQDTGTVSEILLSRDEDITVSHGSKIWKKRICNSLGIADADIKRLAR